MPTPTLATAARRLARTGATTRATRGAHALALRAARVESSARANDALVARDEDVATLTLRARPDARPSAAGLLATLRPRDWALLEHASSRASFASAPSALVRRANGAMVVRMGPTTTLVGPKCAYVFEPATRVAKNIVDTLRTWVGERDAAEGSAGAEARTVKDFPLAALECALEASSRYFEEKIFRLRRLARHCVDEISSDLRGDGKSGIVTGGSLNYNAAQWQKLPPIRRAIKEFEQDAREASEALNAAMTTTNLVPTPMDVVFDEKAAEERNDAVTDVLASHARRLAAVGGLVRELSADLDSARELWELQLDGDRNRTVQMNFRATVFALSAAVAAVPAGLGGMNMPHGLETAPIGVFWSVAGGILIGSTAVWYAFMRRFRKAGELTSARAGELASMQYILGNLDSLDNAFSGVDGSSVTREALRDVMRTEAGNVGAPSETEVFDLLFRIFDTDRSRAIDNAEWRRSE
jgi:hypothetical protein